MLSGWGRETSNPVTAADAANPRDSVLRGSRDYRKAMVEVLVRRALTEAITKAVA